MYIDCLQIKNSTTFVLHIKLLYTNYQYKNCIQLFCNYRCMFVLLLLIRQKKNFPCFAVMVYFAISGKMKIYNEPDKLSNGFTLNKKLFAIYIIVAMEYNTRATVFHSIILSSIIKILFVKYSKSFRRNIN